MVQVNKSSWEYFIVKIATGQIGELNYDEDINKILQLIQLFQDKSKLAVLVIVYWPEPYPEIIFSSFWVLG